MILLLPLGKIGNTEEGAVSCMRLENGLKTLWIAALFLIPEIARRGKMGHVQPAPVIEPIIVVFHGCYNFVFVSSLIADRVVGCSERAVHWRGVRHALSTRRRAEPASMRPKIVFFRLIFIFIVFSALLTLLDGTTGLVAKPVRAHYNLVFLFFHGHLIYK